MENYFKKLEIFPKAYNIQVRHKWPTWVCFNWVICCFAAWLLGWRLAFSITASSMTPVKAEAQAQAQAEEEEEEEDDDGEEEEEEEEEGKEEA